MRDQGEGGPDLPTHPLWGGQWGGLRGTTFGGQFWFPKKIRHFAPRRGKPRLRLVPTWPDPPWSLVGTQPPPPYHVTKLKASLHQRHLSDARVSLFPSLPIGILWNILVSWYFFLIVLWVWVICNENRAGHKPHGLHTTYWIRGLDDVAPDLSEATSYNDGGS